MDDPHELIKRKQIGASIRHGAQKPSRCKRAQWIYSLRGPDAPAYPESTARSGKFLLFFPPSSIDGAWSRVAAETTAGHLGDASKVSSRSLRQLKRAHDHVICVYSYDSQDVEDIARIRRALVALFPNHPIPYKTNRATLDGIYSRRRARS